MYLLYLDESGNENDPADRHFVLGGVALFERQTYFLSEALDRIEQKHFPGRPPVAFHASEIRAGRGFWRGVPEEKRGAILTDLISLILDSPDAGRICYAVVIEKSAELFGEDAVLRATEEMCSRFDIFLMRQFHELNRPERGMLIFSEGRFHARARLWVQGFRRRGTVWGTLRNLADIPYFASASESRLLQVADLVAHAVYLLFERRDARLVRRIIRLFDQREGRLHGLVHVRPRGQEGCDCPACHSKRRPGDLGPWIS